MAVRQQVMRVGEVHIMTYRMVNGFSAIVQVESILVGVRVAAGTERTGTEAETDVMFIVLQIAVGYHFTGIFEPYGFGSICR